MESMNKEEKTLIHISHLHPLKLIASPEPESICHACYMPCADESYGCIECRYFLHITCATVEPSMDHPAHPAHTLAFKCTPSYKSGKFRCGTCGEKGKTFSLSCNECKFDLHLHCAALPYEVNHLSHSHPPQAQDDKRPGSGCFKDWVHKYLGKAETLPGTGIIHTNAINGETTVDGNASGGGASVGGATRGNTTGHDRRGVRDNDPTGATTPAIDLVLDPAEKARSKSYSPLLRGLQQKELYFHLYLYQICSGPNQNQQVVLDTNFNKDFGLFATNDWVLRDWHGAGAKDVARARGFQNQTGWKEQEWYCSHSIVFEDDRFKGSSLLVRGQWPGDNSTFQWGIVGGTGDFPLAHGIIFGKKLSSDGSGAVYELNIHALYLPMQVTKSDLK